MIHASRTTAGPESKLRCPPGFLFAISQLLFAGCGNADAPLAPERESTSSLAVGPDLWGIPCVQFLNNNLAPVGPRACRPGADDLTVGFSPFGLIQFSRDGVPLHVGYYGEQGNTGFVARWINGSRLRDFDFVWTTEGIPTDRGNIPLETIRQANGFLFSSFWIHRVQFTKAGQPFGQPVRVRGDRPHILLFFYGSPASD